MRITGKTQILEDGSQLTDIDKVAGGVALLDASYRFRYISPGAARLFGREVGGLLGRVCWKELPQIAGGEVQKAASRAMVKRVACRAEQDAIPGGSRYEAHCAPVADGLAMLLRDITGLEDAEEFHRILAPTLDHPDDAILVMEAPINDAEPRVIFANPAFTRMTGYALKEILDRSPRFLKGPDTNKDTCAAIQERLRDGKPCTAEILNYRKNGTAFWVELRAHAVADEWGQYTHWVAVLRDISSQKEVEDVLARSARDYITLTDGLPFSIVRYDRDLNILYVNEAVARYFGVPREEIVGKNLAQMGLTGRMIEQRRIMVEQVFLTGLPVITELCSPHTSGEMRWFETRIYPEFDVDGKNIVSVVAVNQDIHDRRLAGESLRRNEEHLRRLIENSPDCIKILNLSGHLQTINEGGMVALGVDDFEKIRGAEWALLWPEETQVIARKAIAAATSGERSRFQGYGVTLNGTLKFWDNIITPLRDAEGKAESLLCISRDITDIKKLEEQKESLLREARERADRDPLTGLYTHRAFLERLDALSAIASQSGAPLAVAVLDVDNFKFFNEAFGHLGGDAVLNHIANGLRHACRAGDIIARFGGDEFAVLLPGLDRTAAECLLKESLQDGEFGQGYHPEDHSSPIPLRISIGVAAYPGDAETPLQTLALADERLFDNKREEPEDWNAIRAELTAQFPSFSLLDSLVMAVDVKNRYTRRHSEEVMTYAATIAAAVRLSEAEQRLLMVAALVHDAGMVGVTERLLRLPRRLQPDEYEQIKQHAALGAGLAQTMLNEPRITEAVRHHHEAWDGTGYPDGLAGEDIPALARILAVADSYSAMTSDRPYRRRLSENEALNELERGAGKQWDANFVQAFVQAMRSR